MGTSVDVGDAATTLEQSRAQADATAKSIAGGALTAPDVTSAPPLKIGRAPQVKPSKGLGPPAPALTIPDVTQPSDEDSLPHGDLTPPPSPAPEQTQAKPGTWDQTDSEVGNGIMRGYAELARAVMLAGSVPAIAADKIHSFISGRDETGAQDAVFKAIDDYANTAVQYWHPQDQAKSGLGAQVLGDVAGVVPALTTGAAALPALTAKAVSDTGIESVQAGQDAKTAAKLATIAGVANALGMKIPLKNPAIWKRIASSVLGNEAISAGTQELTKMILNSSGYKDAAAKIDLTDPRSILSTLAIAIGFGLHRQAGATPKEADKAAQDGTKVGQPPAPDASQTTPDAGTPPPGPAAADNVQPPPPPAASGTQAASVQSPAGASAPAPNEGMPSAPAAEPKVPDMPSIESSKDLRAQIRDMNDKTTPRVGVLLAKDSLTSLAGSKDANALSVNGTLNQARTQNRTIQLPQGELMLKTAKIAAATQARLDAGEDPQAVIGSVTGAGSGKSPDQTVVVQGQTPTGAVATETAVRPDEAHIAIQKAVDQGKTPVVTTPQEAVQRRIDEISKERNSPTQMGIMTNPDGSQVAVHVEPGAPDGMTRVRQLDENGEPHTKVFDVDSQRVKVATATATEVPGPSKAGEQINQKPVVSEAVKTAKTDETPTSPTRSVDEGKVVGTTESAPAKGDEPVQTPTEDTSRSTPPAAEVAPTEQTGITKVPAERAAEKEGDQQLVATVAKTSEPPASPKLKAAKIETPLEALPKALENHESQEAIPPGKKFAASLADRQENASLFANILKSAADSARGKVEPAAIERATRASKAAIGYADKSKEATAKGQGTSHVKITALVAEMHKAARGLLGSAREGDNEVIRPKEAELKAKQERTRARLATKAKEAAAPKEGTNEPKTEVPVNEKYKGDIRGTKAPEAKPAVQVQRDASRLMDRYIHAENEDAPGVHAEIEQFLHEHMGDEYTPDQIKDVLQLLHEQRVEQNPNAARIGPRKMSDTLEDEVHEQETSPKALKTLGLRSGSKHMLSAIDTIKQKVFNNRMATEWQRLGTNLKTNEGLSTILSQHLDSGKALGAHELLNRLIMHTDTPVLKAVLENLRAKVPDVPVHFVSEIQDLHTGKAMEGMPATGLFSKNFDSVQVKPNPNSNMGTAKTIVHELVHAATAYEVHENPNGQLAQALESARKVLQTRMARKYGQETLEQHAAYFRGETPNKPEDYQRHLYGLTNVDEMMAELHVNPEFVQEIADSEAFAQGEEPLNNTFLGGAKTLLFKMYNAIGRFLGISDPKLLQHIAGLTDKTMEVQHKRAEPGKPFDFLNKTVHDFESELVTAMRTRYGANPLEISRALPAFREMAYEPSPLPREGDIMRSIGDDETAAEPTRVARLFRQAMNSGAVDAVRAIKTSLKTVPQLFRDHRRDFGGRDDPANPLNRLQEVNAAKTKIIHDMSEISRPVAKAWMKLNGEDNIKVGSLLRDATMYKLDPRKTLSEQTPEGKDDPKAAARHAEFEARYKALSQESREVFNGALDASKNLARAERRANIDTALESFSDTPVTDAQRTLLYGARRPEQFEDLVGEGKLIDVGENNDKLKAALNDFAGQSELNGPYAHLGRHGDYVVSAEPEGTRKFADEPSARRFAKEVGDLSPNSRGTYVLRGGEHQVDYKVQYTSFHDTRGEAESELARMKEAGYKVGMVTRKTMSREDTPLSAGTRDLVAAAESKINRNGKSAGNEALVAGLRSAFLQLAAQRSAYAGSRMARKNFAGVKPEEMRRNFADHAQSTIWHTAQLRTTFKQAAALAKLRDMARDAHNEDVDQQTMYRRGEVVSALNAHMKDEVANFGHKSPFNTGLARLGFMSYLASPSHAFIWMTQNFTTGIPVAGARWGYGRATSSFGSAMKLLTGPALRNTVHAIFSRGGGADEVNKAILDAVKADKRFGKWAQGPNSHLQQLIDRGVLGHSYSNELHEMAQSGKSVLGVPADVVNRAFEWARLLPNMADSWNRVSTALAALEMTGGDIRKTSDFVDEVHADYSSEAKPLAFKKIGRVPGMNSITMFKIYTQSMVHLFYGNLKSAMVGGGGTTGRMEAAKAAAGMVVANALFAGVYGAAAIEPLRLAVYAYHKLFDKEGEVFDLKNAIHRYLVEHFGKTGGDIAAGGLPHIAGFDLSSRMGLADLFFHEPPDLFSADKDAWKNFVYNEAGPMVSFLAERTSQFVGHMQKGEAFQAVSSLIPVKMYQDAVKAAQLATTGKQNSLGGQMTKPSALDAAYQLFGLKPASVAEAQEKSTVKVNYNAEVKATRDSILKAFVAADPQDRPAAQARINAFNKLHPAEAIKPQDQIKMMKYRQQSQSQQPGRDTTLNKMLNY
jgi:Large polyvalent protein associated domain 39